MSLVPPSAPPAMVPSRLDRRWQVTFILAALAALYFLTIPSNHTEAEDGFWYAYDTREKPLHALFHFHHLLYLPLMRLIYTLVHFVDAFQLMIGVDILCAVGTLGLLYRWLDRGLQIRWQANLFACLFLAFSYGFWRYAVEAEVYLPACVLMVLLASRVFRRMHPPAGQTTWGWEIGTALLGAAAMLMHAPLSTPLAVVAVPLYLLGTRRFRALAVYGSVATVLVFSAYYTAYHVESTAHDPEVPPVAHTFTGYLTTAGTSTPLDVEWTDFPKAVTGLGASVVSTNYLFAIPATRDKLYAAFPARNFTEEAFMARSFSSFLAYLGMGLTLILLGILGFAIVRRMDWRPTRLRSLLGTPECLAIFLWLFAYCVLVFVTEPEDPENWVCGLLPIAVVAGLLMDSLYWELDKASLPWVFVGLLFAQNVVGGFLIIHHPESDFNRDKAAWVVSHAQAGDVVFTRDNEVFTRYLRYYTPALVVNFHSQDAAYTRATIEQFVSAPHKTLYLFEDVLEPPGYLRVQCPGMYDDLASLRRDLQPKLQPTEAHDVLRLP